MSSGSAAVSDARTEHFIARSFVPALVLLGLVVVINYVDRGNLSIAALVVKDELRLSGTQLGLLFSAFFYTYTALQFVVGGAVDRFGANRVLGAGLLLWSLATVATGFAGGFVTRLALRLLLGIGESVAFPCTSKVIAQNVPPEGRGLANGVVTAGLKLGPAVGAFGAGPLIAMYGWRPVFFIGIVPAVLLVFIRRGMVEPDHFLAVRERRAAARKAGGPLPARVRSFIDFLARHIRMGDPALKRDVSGRWRLRGDR